MGFEFGKEVDSVKEQLRLMKLVTEKNLRACGSPHVPRGAQAIKRTWIILVGSAEEIDKKKGLWGFQK